MCPFLQPGLTRTALQDSRLGQRLDTWLAAQRHRVCGALALTALAVAALAPPWLPQDTTPLSLYGA